MSDHWYTALLLLPAVGEIFLSGNLLCGAILVFVCIVKLLNMCEAFAVVACALL